MKPQIIITPCVCKDGTPSAIVAVSNYPTPIIVSVAELGTYVQSLLVEVDKEDSKKPAKTNKD